MSGILAEFHFLRPAWLLLLGLLPLLPWLWLRANRRGSPWRRVVDPHLLPQLLEPGGHGRRRSAALPLLLLAVLLLALALAGPAWRQLPQPVLRSQAGLVIALDLSERMRATDLAPDRLQRARYKIADLLRAQDGQVGLVAYAGDAFTVVPLTTDAATLESLLSALEPELMPVPGQRADRAIELAEQLGRDAGIARLDVLLLTDAVDERALAVAAEARQRGVRVSVLGVGTDRGAPIPLAGGRFATDAGGRPLLAALQGDMLQRLASVGGGRYQPISADDADLRRLALPASAPFAGPADDRLGAPEYRDEGVWLVLLLLPLAALGFRRGWLGGVALLLLLPLPQPAQAIDFEALWRRDDQRAQRALDAGEHERAAALARDPALRGAARYRGGDYAAAGAAFAERDDADAHYNRGNALARAGEFEAAIAAYDEALARQPGMDDAIANRALVEQALQQQQSQSSGEGEGEPQPGTGEAAEDGESSSAPESGDAGENAPGDGDPSSPPPPGTGEDARDGDAASPPAGDGSEAEAPVDEDESARQQALSQAIDEAMQQDGEDAGAAVSEAERARDESVQASEQMLRRIPDDPGGLLRRKFALEHRRRLSEGRDNE